MKKFSEFLHLRTIQKLHIPRKYVFVASTRLTSDQTIKLTKEHMHHPFILIQYQKLMHGTYGAIKNKKQFIFTIRPLKKK